MSTDTKDPMHLEVKGKVPEMAVELLIEHAADLQVSDLFFCSNEDNVAVMVRHLGVLRPISVLNTDQGRRCLAHIKALAGMDVSERRRPLDGRWIHQTKSGHMIDLRINTLPTMYGEDFTLRLLDRTSKLLNLEQLGLLQRDYNVLLSLLSNPGGLILVTGPTGSGKTTTLYACLSHLNNGQRKINTIEDPIEYAIRGIRQAQVNPRLDVNFPEMLRGVLRQAPDVIMIGEIRDAETAETAVRAANSGHLVLATLHAPVAAGAVASLLNLGVHPHFLASSLLGVLAQRLVRTLCKECKIGFDLYDSPHTFDDVKRFLQAGEGDRIFGANGCPACRMMGFAGRTAVVETIAISPALRRLIMERQPMQVLRKRAIEEGMIEFRQSALLKVAQGETSIEEVFRSIPTEYLGTDYA